MEVYRGKGGVKFWALHGDTWVVGGAEATGQDAVSLNHTPQDSCGRYVKIDRFQVRKQFRKLGFGTLIMNELVRLYLRSGALKFVVPVATAQGSRFYRKFGFVRGIERHEYE